MNIYLKKIADIDVSMTSLEISKLTKKQHKDVLRDIRTILEELEFHGADLRCEIGGSESRDIGAICEELKSGSSESRSEIDGSESRSQADGSEFKKETYKSRGKEYPMYRMNQQAVYVLLMGYSASLRERVMTYVYSKERETRKLNLEKECWNISRLAVRDTNKDLKEALKDEYMERKGKEPNHWLYTNENIMIFKMATGLTQKEFKKVNGLSKDEKCRDYLTEQQIKLITKLEVSDTALLEMGIPKEKREPKLQKVKVTFLRKMSSRAEV